MHETREGILKREGASCLLYQVHGYNFAPQGVEKMSKRDEILQQVLYKTSL